MFQAYTDSDITTFHRKLEDLLEEARATLPEEMVQMVLARTGQDSARRWAQAQAEAGRPLPPRFDLVHSLETWTGIVDHADPKLQCRGETAVHRLLEDALKRLDATEEATAD